MTAPALSIRDLSVAVRGLTAEQEVVRQVSFELWPGETLALVGESGCGKTKTAEAILRLLPSDRFSIRSASIRLGDRAIHELPEAGMRRIRGREISMVFQDPSTALDPVFTVGNQLAAIFRRHRGLGRAEAGRAAQNMLRRVGLADGAHIMSCYPHELSGGMQQRVMIGLAMACEPQVLLADEPTTALDVTTQAQVLDSLTGLGRETGTAILLITHDLGLVAQYCDRALVMFEGEIVEEATVRSLFQRPRHPHTRGLLAASRQGRQG